MTDPTATPAAPTVVDQLSTTARQALATATGDLSAARAQRDGLNAEIALLVVTVADLRRIVAALTRGTRRKAKGGAT